MPARAQQCEAALAFKSMCGAASMRLCRSTGMHAAHCPLAPRPDAVCTLTAGVRAMQYMDRTFVKCFNITPVFTRGMEIFTDEVPRGDTVGPFLKNLFLQQARPFGAALRSS